MSRILKHPLQPVTTLQLPVGAKLRHVAEQHGGPTLWIEHPNQTKIHHETETWQVEVYATGVEIPLSSPGWLEFLGTTVGPTHVWHCFRRHLT